MQKHETYVVVAGECAEPLWRLLLPLVGQLSHGLEGAAIAHSAVQPFAIHGSQQGAVFQVELKWLGLSNAASPCPLPLLGGTKVLLRLLGFSPLHPAQLFALLSHERELMGNSQTGHPGGIGALFLADRLFLLLSFAMVAGSQLCVQDWAARHSQSARVVRVSFSRSLLGWLTSDLERCFAQFRASAAINIPTK